MDDAVDDRGGEFVVGKDGAPFAEFDVGGEDDTASFIGAGDDLVEQAGAVDVEGHVAEFIEDDQIGAGQVLEDLIETAGAFGLAQLQDEFGGLAETHGASLPDGFDAQGDGQMGLASSGASVEDEVLGVVEELEAGELVVLLQCLFSRLISIFPQCGRMVFPGLVIMQSVM